MNKDINNSVESQAEQCEWLDVSYTARQYSQDEQANTATAKPRRSKGKKGKWKVVALSVLTVFVLVSAVFISTNGGWDSVTDIYLSSVFSSSSDTTSTDGIGGYQSIDLPYNVDIVSVDSGVVTFDGGSIVVSFTAGTVTTVGDGTVSVALDDSTTIVYGNISECYVVVGSELEYCDVIGKYDDTATVSIINDDITVTNLVGSDYILQWSV